jgi:homoserine O-succinyltransferase
MPAGSLFLFLQGHPEYGAETLGREYLRDMGRFLRREVDERPRIPENYFDRATENRLAEAPAQVESDLPQISDIVTGALPRLSWRNNTVRLFANWLTLAAATKARRMASRSVHTRRRAS